MQDFKTYLVEAAASRGEEMEHHIVNAVNGDAPPKGKYDIPDDAGTHVKAFLAKKGVKGKGKVLGDGNIQVSKEWSEFWPGGKVPASTKTPKTDFVIGSTRISLKAGDSAQLMSGGRNESVATFYTALHSVEGMQKDIVNKLTTMFEGLAPASLAKDKLGKEIKRGKDEMVMKANAAHKELMGELRSIFASSASFANAFAYEAMSGEVKFGPSSPGSCTHFLTTSFDGKKNKLTPVSNDAYVAKIAKQMKVSVRFKTSSEKKTVDGKKVKTGNYKYWSAVGLIVDKLEESFGEVEGQMLTEGVIMNIVNKVKDFVKKIFKKIKDYLQKSFYNVVQFLEAEPVVRVGKIKQW